MKNIESILSSGRFQEERFIADFDELKPVVDLLRFQGKKIVLTSGVYDLIHMGHARYMEEAKKHGDILIVGVDSDELTKVRKGPSRPIVPEDERIEMLLHLRHVDIVTIYHPGKDNSELLELIKPDVFIMSETTKDVARQKETIEKLHINCVLLPSQAPLSSSQRIRQLLLDGAIAISKIVKQHTETLLKEIESFFEQHGEKGGGDDLKK